MLHKVYKRAEGRRMGKRLAQTEKLVRIIHISQHDGSESFLPRQEVPKKVDEFALVNPVIHQRSGYKNISSQLLQK